MNSSNHRENRFQDLEGSYFNIIGEKIKLPIDDGYLSINDTKKNLRIKPSFFKLSPRRKFELVDDS